MKRIFRWQGGGTINILAPACLALLLLWSPARADEPLRVGVVEVPGEYLSIVEGRLEGLLARLYRCVFAQAGVDAEFVPVPLKRGWFHLDRGELDALIPMAQTAQRDEIGDFAGELFNTEYAFVTVQAMPPILNDAQGLRYGLLRGSVGRSLVPDSAVVVEEVTSGAQLVPMLKRDRIDVAVMPTVLADVLVGQQDDTEVFVQTAGSLPVSIYLTSELEATGITGRVKQAVGECRL